MRISYQELNVFMKNIHVFIISFILILFIAYMVFEAFSSHTFIGKLVIKEAPISYSYDEEVKRWDGRIWKTSGRDETTATKKYTMTFSYDGGQTKTLVVESVSASVPYVRRDDLALAALKNKDTVPYEYQTGKMYVEYLVEVQGYFTTGYLLNITPISSFRAEN
jgi:hypothetical protein